MAYNLENNPLFPQEQEKPAKRGKGRPQSAEVVHNNSVQEGLHEDYTRATFILRVETLKKLKDYAYTERLTMKDAVDKLLSDSLAREEKRLKKEGKELLSKGGTE
jgi:hypothetical protein